MSINPRTVRTIKNEDQSWIAPGGVHAFQDNQSVVLDRSAFDLVTAFPNGYLPSGVVLGVITATGLYGPYSDAGAGGLDTAAGFLAVSVPMSSTGAATDDEAGALYWHGQVDASELPTGNGLTTAARADLAAKFSFI